MGKFVRRPVGGAEGGAPKGPLSDPEFERLYPALWEYLTLEKWEDGRARATSTVLLFLGQGGLQGCLSDRDAARVAFVTDVTFAGVLERLDRGLQEDSLDWRQQRQQPGTKRGK